MKSGMEHVFLAELKDGVSGFHNWVFFAKQEEAGLLNCAGWMKFLDMGTPGALIQHKFVWCSACKPISSMFIGTSPEFELAVYSACLLVRPGSTTCPMLFDTNPVKVTTYTIGSSSQYVASSYADPVLP
ncbi:poly(U)-specific endoribonuclease homolog [Folsomia candida]|uniref:poly(U)-specific endoribonuclease homolog n=1 Tax=Folsomia candida TaxID=158441 RepID=UPI000B8F1BFF|nr:poly(U)-specific endoribonuclease homolog [Folsomia candida]